MADPFFPYVKGLYHFDGSPTAYRNDSSGNSHTIGPNLNGWGVSLGTGKFTDCAGRTGAGVGSRAEIPHHADFVYDGDFTVEGWAFRATTGNFAGIVGKWGTFTTFTNQWGWILYWDTSNRCVAQFSLDGTTVALTLTSAAVSASVWHNIAIDRSSNLIRLYIDGVMAASGAISATLPAPSLFNNTSAPVMWGAFNGGNSLTGNAVDEWRFTKGVARYATDAGFTAPGAPYPEVGDPPTRVTQAGFMVSEVSADAPVRVTQAGFMVSVTNDAPVRVTQAGFMVGIKQDKPACLTFEADCWKITRADGTVYRFTSHDRNVNHNGESYKSCGSLTASALQLSAIAGETDNLDLTGLVYDNGIKEIDLWAGLFNSADVEIWRVEWTDTASYSRLIIAGRTGDLQMLDTTYKFEVTTASERLQERAVLQTVTAACRYLELGETRCTVNVALFTVTGAVTGIPSVDVRTCGHRRAFTDSGRLEASQYFQLGKLTWTSGLNNGRSFDVRSFEAGAFVLETMTQFPIGLGDTYSVIAGDDKSHSTCVNKFGNGVNFGGFPYLKGTDDLNRTPGRDDV